MGNRTLKVAAAAINQTPIDWKNNQNNIREAITQAKKQNAELLCLPELCITGYSCEDLFFSKWVPEKAMAKLLEIKNWCIDITISVGLPVRYENKLYNCAALISNQEILGITAKQHLPNYGVHYEGRWFSKWPAGQEIRLEAGGHLVPFGDIVYEVKGIKIAFEICEDAWSVKRPAYSFYERGVDLILNPSASHFSFGKTKLREDIVLSASEKFRCGYIYVNALGNESGTIIYDGEIIIAHNNRLNGKNRRFSFQNVDLLVCYMDFENPNESSVCKESDIEVKFKELRDSAALALFDYMRKSRSQGFILSLSGGADSSICAVLVSEMVKKGVEELGMAGFIEKSGILWPNDFSPKEAKDLMPYILHCAYQSTKNSTEDTFNSAKSLAEDLGAQFSHWSVDKPVEEYIKDIEEAIGRKLNWDRDDIALQNIQARARSPIIWMLANIKNALLITTSNRSEADVGYATMDGDTSGSIAPVGGIDKITILEWLLWAEYNLGYGSLSHVNNLAPSAELRPKEQEQTDEQDLMPYPVIAAIERLAIEFYKSPLEVYDILKDRKLESPAALRGHIVKFFQLWSRNQWKRERYAPSFLIDTFSVDPKSWYRFPILSGGYDEELKALLEME
ncbi:MAG: NAD(+) synthase [Candidatus Cyclobacteriaceae bacterium M2_1C_046]